MKARRSVYSDKNDSVGLPQGDPLSTLLYSMTVQRVLNEAQSYHCKFYEYVDDIVIVIDKEHDAHEVLKQVAQLLNERLGLTLNMNKCQLLTETNDIKFLGQEFTMQGAVPVANRILSDLKQFEEIINLEQLSMKEKIILFKYEILPKASWGPMYEAGNENREAYKQVDDYLIWLFMKIIDKDGTNKYDLKKLGEFLNRPIELGGLGLLMPYYYYEEFR